RHATAIRRRVSMDCRVKPGNDEKGKTSRSWRCSCNRESVRAVTASSISERLTITVGENARVSGLLDKPPHARACYVLAHGAGAGMAHPFMAAVAGDLAQRGIATLRYQFAYMERGSKRPDPPQLAHAAVRAAVMEAQRLVPDLPLFAGGKSFGGRMTSQ